MLGSRVKPGSTRTVPAAHGLSCSTTPHKEQNKTIETLGYIASALIGLSLGLIGGGGSTLTVPVLVYLFGIPATQATGYSLFVVGVTAAVGAFFAARRNQVDIRTGAVFALPALVSVYVVRRLVVPALPDTLFTVGGTDVTRDAAILVLFGTLMLFAAVAMIRPRKTEPDKENGHAWKLSVKGLLVGMVTGLVGAGGGFLIVPALIFFARLPMKTAVGTSLAIIALNSLVGFVGEVQATSDIAWALLGTVTTIAVAGIVVGGLIGKKISGAKLKPAFGWFVLTMGVFLVGNTLISGG